MVRQSSDEFGRFSYSRVFQQSVLIAAHRSDVPSINLIHFILLNRSIHWLLRDDDAPLADSALKRSQLTPAVAIGITGYQRVSCVAVAQRVGPDPLTRCDRAQLLSTFHRCLHPAPGCRGMRLYDSALVDVPVSKCAAQSAVQLRMHRHKSCLTAFS